MQPTSPSRILMIGADGELVYLIGRYAEQSGYDLAARQIAPPLAEVLGLQPAVILFLSVEDLAGAQSLIADLAGYDLPVLVCLSLADEAQARELGADQCLLHPLTYDRFVAALAATQAAVAQV